MLRDWAEDVDRFGIAQMLVKRLSDVVFLAMCAMYASIPIFLVLFILD